MDSTGSSDPRAEVARLAADLRAALERHARGGRWSAPGGASPRIAAHVEAAHVEAAHVEPAHAPAIDLAVDVPDAPPPRVRLTLAEVRAELGECTRCKLHETRKKIVFGAGSGQAALMFVGEAPGADEDRTGEPFVGKAGELLDKMIEAMGFARGDVYIANVLKCRPPGNRNPQVDEVASCSGFLDAQITAVAPRILVALGRPAANTLLGIDAPISALRGRFHDRRGLRVMPTFHPAYLLREPDRKRDAWSDLKQVMAELERLGVGPRPR